MFRKYVRVPIRLTLWPYVFELQAILSYFKPRPPNDCKNCIERYEVEGIPYILLLTPNLKVHRV